MGSVDPESQVHDFAPPITPSGLFWTVLIPDDAVTVDLAAGTAELHVQSLEMLDSYTIPNNLAGGPAEPATAGFDLSWSAPTAVESLVNAEQGFAGTFLEVTSALQWSAQTAEFAFVSDPPQTSTSLFSRIGYEANGVFFHQQGIVRRQRCRERDGEGAGPRPLAAHPGGNSRDWKRRVAVGVILRRALFPTMVGGDSSQKRSFLTQMSRVAKFFFYDVATPLSPFAPGQPANDLLAAIVAEANRRSRPCRPSRSTLPRARRSRPLARN